MPAKGGFAAKWRLALAARPKTSARRLQYQWGNDYPLFDLRPAISLVLRCSGRFTLRTLVAILSLAPFGSLARAEHAADTIDEKRRAIAAEIHEVSDAAEKGDQKGEADDRLTQLRALDVLYVQIQARREERQHLEEQKKALDRAVESLEKFELDEPKPYSFLLYDSLQDQLEVEKQRGKALEAESKSIAKMLAAAHEALDHVSGSRHEGDSEATAPSTSQNDAPVARGRRQVELREMEVEINKLRKALCDAKQKELEQKIKVVKKEFAFSAADRDKQLGVLSESEARLQSANACKSNANCSGSKGLLPRRVNKPRRPRPIKRRAQRPSDPATCNARRSMPVKAKSCCWTSAWNG